MASAPSIHSRDSAKLCVSPRVSVPDHKTRPSAEPCRTVRWLEPRTAAITTIPEWALKLLVGTLLLLFGLRWLHKAVLRSAGVVAMHDEVRAFQDTVNQLGEAVTRRDWVGFILALKGVFLEGLEVVFIVIAVGGPGHAWTAAITGGLTAAAVVAAAGLAVRKPLARVPENTLKYAVGILLTSLGTFWAAEGMGASWPGDFLSIFALAGIFVVASRLAVTLIRRPAFA